MTTAKIDDVVILGSSPATWKQRAGIHPAIGFFDVAPRDLEAVLSKRTVTLDLGGTTFTNLFPLHAVPSGNPNVARVAIADSRIFWSYAWIKRSFNYRRHTGYRRPDEPAAPPEIEDIVPRVQYAPWSIKAYSTPFTADEILEGILSVIAAKVVESGGSGFFYVEPELKKKLSEYPVENLVLDDSADLALKRVLEYLPEADVTVDPSGRIRVYSRASGKERSFLDDLGPEIVDEGNVVLVENSRIRPSRIDVLFTREVELRFDFVETGYGMEEEAREMQNVLALPDFSLDVDGTTLVQGTWITFLSALTAWGTAPGIGRILSRSDIQRAIVPFLGLWAGLELLGLQQPDVDWSSRVGAIMQHYRRSFRINPNWMEKIFELRAYRVATIDPTTGTRAPAIAYTNWSYLASQRSLWKAVSGEKTLCYASNVIGRPGSSASDPITSDWRAAPAKVAIADHDQGVIYLEFSVDPFRVYDMVLPSTVEAGGSASAGNYPSIPGPDGNLREISTAVTFDAVARSHGREMVPKLSDGHLVTVILTAIPGMPNDKRQLHRISRRIGDVSKLLPPGLRIHLGSNGPPMEIHVGPGIETARIAWSDDDSDRIEKVFGVDQAFDDDFVDLSDLCVNQGSASVGASLDSIADAVAARVYAMFADHYEGDRASGAIGPHLLVGRTEEISTTVSTSGSVLVHGALPADLPRLNLFALLDSSSRAMILKLGPSKEP